MPQRSPVLWHANFDDHGNSTVAEATAAIAGNAASTTVVKAAGGRLMIVVVTAAGTSTATTIYDSASTGTGTILAVIPATTAVGTQLTINLPAAVGITVVQGASSVGLTIGYN
jgi:hypothetical protein